MSTETDSRTIIGNILSLWSFLGARRRIQLGLFFVLTTISVFAEILSISAVIPFITILVNPDAILSAQWLTSLLELFGLNTTEDLLLPFTVFFIAAVILAASIRLIALWVRVRLTMAMGLQLRTTLYSRVLHQPYDFHVNHNSSELISMVTEKVGLAINAGVMHVMVLLNAVILATGVIATLLYLEPFIALVSSIILGTFYISTVLMVRRKVREDGKTIARNQPLAVKCLQEGIGGIRDVIMDRTHNVFVESYVNAAYKIQNSQSRNQFRGEVPRPLIEMAGVILIALLAYGLQRHGGADASPFPLLAAFAVGAQRLLPSLQQIFFSWTMISGAQSVVEDVVRWLELIADNESMRDEKDKLHFSESISLKGVSFNYPDQEAKVLDHIDLTIHKGQRVGLIGQTGSGKSTLVDIVMGLLRPTRGELLVDHKEIMQGDIHSWRMNIAHVPQSIFLSDSSIGENIAFGVPTDQIDFLRIEDVARKARISQYIEGLPDGYKTLVGERGIRLSGGQRQRIGIARALYKDAELIIFDEATSALDSETESQVMKAISSLDGHLTVLIIAHRLSTLADCDVVYRLKNGLIMKSHIG